MKRPKHSAADRFAVGGDEPSVESAILSPVAPMGDTNKVGRVRGGIIDQLQGCLPDLSGSTESRIKKDGK